ncbi:UDP-4-amino-4,6-dideoxy-N-acetyl-beta-L-altrosamine transaminase [Gammaproteobacteria bacterium]|nr:UDP-4-amino-4,6-dideoxy-N-acetyl-beta-L-altrosamine transaminase [Gammaproteobacteria bacterium]
MIPYGKQNINKDDIESVIDVLNSDFLTQGPVVPKFEDTLSSYCQSEYGVAVNSATSGLHIACLALGLQPGDIVWTSPNSFVASANCALYCGATVDFVDIDLSTNNISITALKEKLQLAEKKGLLPKIIIPVHLSGLPCEMSEIYALSLKYGFRIIEDASHAIGAKYSIEKNYNVGNCLYSDITVFSFHPVKIITTCEGGLCVTQNKELSEKMQKLKSHGIVRYEENIFDSALEKWNYAQEDLGFNYRMTDLQAALGLSQLKRLDHFINKRNSIAEFYSNHLKGLPIDLPTKKDDILSSYHLYIIKLKKDCNKSRNDLYKYLVESGIGVNLHYIPIYRHPVYEKLGFRKGYCIEAETYFENALSIPIFPDLSEENLFKVVNSIKKYF